MLTMATVPQTEHVVVWPKSQALGRTPMGAKLHKADCPLAQKAMRDKPDYVDEVEGDPWYASGFDDACKKCLPDFWNRTASKTATEKSRCIGYTGAGGRYVYQAQRCMKRTDHPTGLCVQHRRQVDDDDYESRLNAQHRHEAAAHPIDDNWITGERGATRCTEVVLNAFGIYGIVPTAGADVLSALRAHGWYYYDVDYEGTVRMFVRSHPTGSWYIMTAGGGHGMALIDGKLHDFESRGADGRRVSLVYEITKENRPPVKMKPWGFGMTSAASAPLYHGTTMEGSWKIGREGIKAAQGKTGMVYLATDPQRAAQYAREKANLAADHGVVVKVDASKLEPENLTDGARIGEYVHFGTVPASAVSAVSDAVTDNGPSDPIVFS